MAHQLITTADAAEQLGVSRSRVLAMITAGKLPALKVGRDWLINSKDLDSIRIRPPGRPRNEV